MTFAQLVGSGNTGLVGAINGIIIPTIITLAGAAAVVGVAYYFFLWGGVQQKEGSAKKVKGRTEFVLWSIIGLVILFSIWGIINIILSTLGLQ